jgi:two-component system OmpR family response regulator
MGINKVDSNKLKKIMLIEDEADIRTIARISLERIGNFSVCYCASGKEAMQVVEEFSPDLILLDVMMPEMDGTAVFISIKNLPSMAMVPVIFMTAKIQPQLIAQYRSLGAIDVIPKPFNPITLPDIINKIWLNYRGAQQ